MTKSGFVLMSCLVVKPFISNDNCEEDGTVEDDVIDRVEELGEDDGIDFTVKCKWPLKY